MSLRMSDHEWDSLVEFIKQEQCAVFVGPQLTLDAGQANRQAAFFRQFREQNADSIASFHERDQLLVFKSRSIRNRLISRIKTFYEQDFGSPILDKLAQLPFPLFVCTTPDISLRRSFERQGFVHQFNYYNRHRERPIEAPPTAQCPLVYNLLGCTDDWDTLLVSHADVFDYIRQSYRNNFLQPLRALLQADGVRYLLFLGFELDKWYFQLLLSLLDIDSDEVVRYATLGHGSGRDGSNESLFESHFRFEFVSEGLTDFVDALYARFQTSGALRTASGAPSSLRSYHLAAVTKLLVTALDGTQLDTFAMCYFTEVYDDFANGQGKTQRATMLVDYAKRHHRIDELLAYLRDENPAQYQACEPYWV